MICGIKFMDQAVKLGKGVNELSSWYFGHASEE